MTSSTVAQKKCAKCQNKFLLLVTIIIDQIQDCELVYFCFFCIIDNSSWDKK